MLNLIMSFVERKEGDNYACHSPQDIFHFLQYILENPLIS
jgi:hypothetical protein